METTARRETGLSDFSTTMLRPSSAAPHRALLSETLSTARLDAPVPSRRRRVVIPIVNPKLAYKITLPQSIHQRLRLAAIEHGVSVSTLTAQILDQHLPERT